MIKKKNSPKFSVLTEYKTFENELSGLKRQILEAYYFEWARRILLFASKTSPSVTY